MTREEARKAADVMLAYANGEEVEAKGLGGKYNSVENPSFSWDKIKYRVKPKPTYRPFKNKEECWNEMLKHKPFGWTKHIESQIYENCGYVGNKGIDTASYKDAHKYYTFADGTPFGIKEE